MTRKLVRLSCFCLFLVPTLGTRHAAGEPETDPICGDLFWSADPCEYCGKDAYYQTGHVEMNHDCLVDVVDFALFAHDFGLVGDLSGDFNRDGRVDLLDFQFFALCIMTHPHVTPCTPCGVVPDGCAGTARINFSLLPGEDVDRIDLAPFESAPASVVVQGCPGLGAFTGGLQGSPNVVFESQDPRGNLDLLGGTAFLQPLDASPHSVWGVAFYVTDSEPAFIKVVAYPGDPWGLAWAQTSPARRLGFEVLAYGGINGDPPPDSSSCAVAAVAEPPSAPAILEFRCWPIPATREVLIARAAEHPEHAIIDAYDTAGRLVRHLHDGVLAPREVVRWDARREDGAPAPAGVYFVRMVTPAGSAASRVVLLRE